jgi:hypothetical protein
VEMRGVDPRSCSRWRKVLRRIDEQLIVWESTFRRVFGTPIEPSAHDMGDDESEDSPEPSDVDSYGPWESREEDDQGERVVSVG